MRQPDRDRVQVFFVAKVQPAENHVVFEVELIDFQVDVVQRVFRDLARPTES